MTALLISAIVQAFPSDSFGTERIPCIPSPDTNIGSLVTFSACEVTYLTIPMKCERDCSERTVKGSGKALLQLGCHFSPMCHSLPTNGVNAESKVSDVVAELGSKRDQQMCRLTFANLGPVQCCRDLATNYDPWRFRSRCLAAMAAAIGLLTRMMTPHLWARGFRPGRGILARGRRVAT